MKQKDLYEKCNQLECNITDLTDTHHEVSSKFDADLESHLQKINDFQVKEDETSAKNQRELQIMNDDLKQSMTTMKEEIEKVTTNLDGELDAHSATEKENFKKINTDIEKIDKRIDGHLDKHKVSFIVRNRDIKTVAWESYRNGNFVPNRSEYFHMQKKN